MCRTAGSFTLSIELLPLCRWPNAGWICSSYAGMVWFLWVIHSLLPFFSFKAQARPQTPRPYQTSCSITSSSNAEYDLIFGTLLTHPFIWIYIGLTSTTDVKQTSSSSLLLRLHFTIGFCLQFRPTQTALLRYAGIAKLLHESQQDQQAHSSFQSDLTLPNI